jgi:hypothetical protein
MKLVGSTAEQVKAHRAPAQPGNPLLDLERIAAHGLMQGMDLVRDLRDAAYETSFLSIYGTPFMQWLGQPYAHERTRKDPNELRYLPEVQAMLLGVDSGGFKTSVIRMLILLADSRDSVRRDRLERSSEVLTQRQPFASMSPKHRANMIREQSVIIEFEPVAALAALPRMLTTPEVRRAAMYVVEYIVGDPAEMEPQTTALLQHMRELLTLDTTTFPDPVSETVTAKPVRRRPAAAQPTLAQKTTQSTQAATPARALRRNGDR